MELTETAVAITGATDGIGRALAHQLAGRAALLVLHGRNPTRLAALPRKLSTATTAVVSVCADLAELTQVRRLAEVIADQATGRPLVLLNNAGVAGARTRQLTTDGHELTWQVNYLAPVLLTELLLPVVTAGSTRVINVVSMLHRGADPDFPDPDGERRYAALGAYAQSKLALVIFTCALAQRLAGTGSQAVSLHPGVIDTKILRAMVGGGGAPADVGAAAITYLITTDADINGCYYDGAHPANPHPAAHDPATQQRLAALTDLSLAGYRHPIRSPG